jgi:hypothetical protein
MKKFLIIAGIIAALIAVDLLIPAVELETQMTSFLKNNLNKFMHWINIGIMV